MIHRSRPFLWSLLIQWHLLLMIYHSNEILKISHLWRIYFNRASVNGCFDFDAPLLFLLWVYSFECLKYSCTVPLNTTIIITGYCQWNQDILKVARQLAWAAWPDVDPIFDTWLIYKAPSALHGSCYLKTMKTIASESDKPFCMSHTQHSTHSTYSVNHTTPFPSKHRN